MDLLRGGCELLLISCLAVEIRMLLPKAILPAIGANLS